MRLRKVSRWKNKIKQRWVRIVVQTMRCEPQMAHVGHRPFSADCSLAYTA
jgi:hypothetical protein